MTTTYFSFLSAFLHTLGDNLSTFFAGESDIFSHFRSYQRLFETYATGFGPFGWTLYGFSLLCLTGIVICLGLVTVYWVRRLLSRRAVMAQNIEGGVETSSPATRFPALTGLDERFAANPPLLPESEEQRITLEQICLDFRDYCACSFQLYYEIGLVRGFVSALASTHLLLLEGISGTGKTSLPCRFAAFLGGNADVIPVEPSWREKSELLGYYNDFNREYKQTPFLESLYRALYETGIHFLVLDEVNLSRIEYYFAEFLSLLELPEEEQRLIPLIGKGEEKDPAKLRDGKLPLGSNVYFVGTANHDESTFAITDKVYDRAFALPFSHQGEPFEGADCHPIFLSHRRLEELFAQACEEYALTEESRGKLDRLFALFANTFGLIIGNRIRHQAESFLPAYQACGGTLDDAFDAFLVSKILKKIDSFGAEKRSKLGSIMPQIREIFGMDALPDFIKGLQERSI